MEKMNNNKYLKELDEDTIKAIYKILWRAYFTYTLVVECLNDEKLKNIFLSNQEEQK